MECKNQSKYLQIVILKLKQRTAMEDDRRHWKATKALIFVMPLLGFGWGNYHRHHLKLRLNRDHYIPQKMFFYFWVKPFS